MSRFDDVVDRGLAFDDDEFGDSFTVDSRTYQGVYNEQTVTEELQGHMGGGFLERVVTTLRVRKAVLGGIDGTKWDNKQVLLNNRVWFINKVSSDRNSYTFELGDTQH